jgi:Na+/melibiose symporter-like transporter
LRDFVQTQSHFVATFLHIGPAHLAQINKGVSMKHKALIGWGLGSFTSAALVGAVGLLHLRFMTDSLGMAIGAAGLLVVLSKLYDAAIDPLVGILSDHTQSRWGRHRPYLAGGAILAGVSLVMLFNVPLALSATGLQIWSGASLLLFSTAYTLYRIPYLAIGRQITQDFHERSRLMTFSVYGSSFGGLAATSAAPWMLASLGGDRAAHGLLALVLAALVAAGGIGTFLLIDGLEDNTPTPTRTPLNLRATIAAIAANQPFRSLMAFKIIMFTGLTLHGTALPYYTRHVLHSSDKSLATIFLLQTLGMMASQPAWVRLAARFGRRQALIGAALSQTLFMFCWFLVPSAHPLPWVLILGGLEGLCFGGLFFGLYTVLTDTMDHARAHLATQGSEGALAGVFVMVEKATSALGIFIFSTIMSANGFASAHDAGSAQNAGVMLGIVLALSVLPALAAVLACLFLRPPPLAKTTALLAMAACLTAHPTPSHAQQTGITIPQVIDGPDGLSRLSTITLPRAPGSDPLSINARLTTTDTEIGLSPPGTFIDWHRVSTPRLLVVLSGTLEVGLGDGTTRLLHAGDMVLAADTTGKGHTSRSLGPAPVMAMTIRLPREDPLKSRASSCSDGVAAKDCVANGLSIQHQP